jgi:hypothetical protein
MKWIELNEMLGGEYLFLFGCHPTQSAYKVKRWLQETKPNAVILFADNFNRIKEYEAARWVRKYNDYTYHNYMTTGWLHATATPIGFKVPKVINFKGSGPLITT